MKKYYSEEIVKDTKYRQDYVCGITAFLKNEKKRQESERVNYITPEKLKANPEKYRKDFVSMLGFPLNIPKEIPTVEKLYVTTDKNVKIFRMVFTFFGYLKFYGIYFEQVNQDENTPYIICQHGGEGTPELISSMHFDSSNYNHMARRVTDRGANVFCPQTLIWKVENYGNPFDREIIDGKLKQLGGSITALELYLIRGTTDYFIKKEEINANKIGMIGLSYGGMYTTFYTALDTRVKAAYSCSWVCDGFVWSKPDWSYLNSQSTFAVAETIGLIAPRAFVIGMGDKDACFDYRLTEKEYEKAREYYTVYGKEENLKLCIFDGEHETDKGDEEIDFLINKLK